MKAENYRKIMSLLDIVEAELNKVARAVGHESFEEFIRRNESCKISEQLKAA